MVEAAARDSKYILGVNIANVFIMMARAWQNKTDHFSITNILHVKPS